MIPSLAMPPFWFILLRIIWVALLLLSSVITLLMFAFADSPTAGKVAGKMIGPIFVTTLLLFATSAWLLKHPTWWSIPSAYALVLAPPFLVFTGYNLLSK